MDTKRKIGIMLVVLAVMVLSVTLVRAFFMAPGSDDTGLPAASSLGASTSPSRSDPSTRTADELPARLVIPKLGIDAKIMHVGVNKKGEMAAPPNMSDVSWYKYGAVPGEIGSAVLAGHEDNAVSIDGVFKRLHELEEGDDVYIVRADGERVHFRVTDEEIYPYNNAPLEKIFNASDAARLNLITCAGDWLASAKTNDKRLVIFTKLVE